MAVMNWIAPMEEIKRDGTARMWKYNWAKRRMKMDFAAADAIIFMREDDEGKEE